MRHVRFLGAVGAAIVMALAAACSKPAPLDVVVIVVDTLRADRVGVYGHGGGLTPTIDALAARGAVFAHAYAQSSWTNPSVASILTSRYQSQHGVTNVITVLPESESTLAEVFWLNGYATAGFSANAGISMSRGFSQGYTFYEAYNPDAGDGGPLDVVPVRASVVNEGGLEWLRDQPKDKPVFLWLQYMEPHFPYVLPEPVPELDGAPCPDPVKEKLNDPDGPRPDPAVIEKVERCYDAAVKAADAAIGRLLDELRRDGRLDRTVIAITSDHGEEMMEHGRVGHGYTLFDEVTRVPLIVSVPWLDRRIDVAEVVRLIDVGPTLLQLADIRPPKTFEGRSFASLLARPSLWARLRERVWPAATPDAGPRDEAFSELLSSAGRRRPRRGQHLMSLVEGRKKVILSEGDDAPHAFYDLAADPTEQGDGTALEPPARERLERDLTSTLERATRNPSRPVERTLDPETRRQLEMLGYVE